MRPVLPILSHRMAMEKRMMKSRTAAQVGFEPTFCDKPQFLPLNYLSDEMWCEPVHCSLFFQRHHNACTIVEPNHTYRTHFSFYAGTLIEALPQCVIRKLYRSSRSTSHRSGIECSPSPDSNWAASYMKGDKIGFAFRG